MSYRVVGFYSITWAMMTTLEPQKTLFVENGASLNYRMQGEQKVWPIAMDECDDLFESEASSNEDESPA